MNNTGGDFLDYPKKRIEDDFSVLTPVLVALRAPGFDQANEPPETQDLRPDQERQVLQIRTQGQVFKELYRESRSQASCIQQVGFRPLRDVQEV